MKLFTNECDFDYPWDQVTAANWNKYPNEISNHVIAVDTLRRELDPTGTILTSERLITCKQNVPAWTLALVGGSNVSYVREVSIVDMNKKTLVMRSCNLTYANILKVYETVTYTPHPEDAQKTKFVQQAQITAFGLLSIMGNKLEEFSVNRFHDNAAKGKLGFESVLKVFGETWDQKGELVDTYMNKVNETVDGITEKVTGTVEEFADMTDDVLKETESIIKDTETLIKHTQQSILQKYSETIRNAFRRS